LLRRAARVEITLPPPLAYFAFNPSDDPLL